MTLTAQQAETLAAALKNKVKIDNATVQAYLNGVQKGSSTALKPVELKIAKALARNQPTKFGWANRPNTTKPVLVEARTGVIITGKSGDPITRMEKVVHPVKGLIGFEMMKAHFIAAEGNVNHFYLDTKNNVTIGIGHLVDESPEDMAGWPWLFKDGDLIGLETGKTDDEDAPATDADIEAGSAATATNMEKPPGRPGEVTAEHIQADLDWVRAKGNGGNDNSSVYAPITNLRLDDSKVNELFEADFKTERGKAVEEFPDMNTFPFCVQAGIVDFTYIGLLQPQVYTKFFAAVKRRDWLRAAEESSDNENKIAGVISRNKKRADFLRKGVQTDFFFTTAPEKTKKLIDCLLAL